MVYIDVAGGVLVWPHGDLHTAGKCFQGPRLPTDEESWSDGLWQSSETPVGVMVTEGLLGLEPAGELVLPGLGNAVQGLCREDHGTVEIRKDDLIFENHWLDLLS